MPASFTVAKTIGASPVPWAAERSSRATTASTAVTLPRKGMVCLSKRAPGKFASRALPSVSAVIPVLSDTKNTARVPATRPGSARSPGEVAGGVIAAEGAAVASKGGTMR